MNYPLSATNSTTNADYHDIYGNKQHHADSSFTAVFLFLIGIAISLFGVIANGVVFWYLCFRIRKTPFTVYILNLAMVDFIFLLLFFILLIVLIFNVHHDPGYILFQSILSGYAISQYLLTAISVERCASVMFPIWSRCQRPKHQSAVVCTVIWVVYGLSLAGDFILCYVFYRCSRIIIYQCVISFLLFVPLIFVCNLTLIIKICRSSRQRHPPRLYILIILTVVAFLLLSEPLIMYIFLLELGIEYDAFLETSFVLSVINSSINPVIYFLVGSLKKGQMGSSCIAALRRAFLEESGPAEQ